MDGRHGSRQPNNMDFNYLFVYTLGRAKRENEGLEDQKLVVWKAWIQRAKECGKGTRRGRPETGTNRKSF